MSTPSGFRSFIIAFPIVPYEGKPHPPSLPNRAKPAPPGFRASGFYPITYKAARRSTILIQGGESENGQRRVMRSEFLQVLGARQPVQRLVHLRRKQTQPASQ